jgi:hypothetical protein
MCAFGDKEDMTAIFSSWWRSWDVKLVCVVCSQSNGALPWSLRTGQSRSEIGLPFPREPWRNVGAKRLNKTTEEIEAAVEKVGKNAETRNADTTGATRNFR